MYTNGNDGHLFIFILKVLADIIKHEQEIKGVNIGKEEGKLSLVGDIIVFQKHTEESTGNTTI